MLAMLTNQRGEDTVFCDASIALPSRGKPVVLPEPPADLKERAVKMWARHCELSRKPKG